MSKAEYHYDVLQGSEDWLMLRLGVITASEVKHILTPSLKIADNDKTRLYHYDLASQRINKVIEPHYESWDMQRGTVEEEFAKAKYSEYYSQIRDCGFITNDQWGFRLGFSPDGLVGEKGIVECKSRLSKYQVRSIIDDCVPKEYMLQIQTGLLVSGREWCDFISYSNGMPMMVKRVLPDGEMQNAIIEATKQANEKINDIVFTFEKTVKANGYAQTERQEFGFDEEITASDQNVVNILAAG